MTIESGLPVSGLGPTCVHPPVVYKPEQLRPEVRQLGALGTTRTAAALRTCGAVALRVSSARRESLVPHLARPELARTRPSVQRARAHVTSHPVSGVMKYFYRTNSIWSNRKARVAKLSQRKYAKHKHPSCPWNTTTCARAAENGHLETLKWMWCNGCPLDEGCVCVEVVPRREGVCVEVGGIARVWHDVGRVLASKWR